MIEASCHCGAVRIEIDAAPPVELTECSCSICRRKAGLWTYHSPKQVRIFPASGATGIYVWGDKMIEHHSCKTCACTTHWTAIDKSYDRMGVNARMMAPEIVAGATIRKTPGPD